MRTKSMLKNKYFSLLIAVILVFPIFAFAACTPPDGSTGGEKAELTALAAPTGLTVDGTTLSWTAVANANGYAVSIDNAAPASIAAGTNTYSLESLTAPGVYAVSVKAKGDGETYSDSAWPTSIAYIVKEPAGEEPAEPVQLNTPTGLSISGTTLTWSAVSNAIGYSVRVNSGTPVAVAAASRSYSLANLTSIGSYAVSVKAIGNGTTVLDSVWPASIIYTVKAPVVAAQNYEKPVSYSLVVEGFEWGPSVTKLVMTVSDSVAASAIDKNTFTVNAGVTARTIINAFISDSKGNRQESGSSHYITLEMLIGYEITTIEIFPGYSISFGSAIENSSPFAYNNVNEWAAMNIYTVALAAGKTITLGGVEFLNFNVSADQYAGKISPMTDGLAKGKHTVNGRTLSYAAYSPEKDKNKNPLIIWLHGAGEGGTDVDIALLGNDVTKLMKPGIQNYFANEELGISGAYVLACQTPTMWMDSGSGQNHAGDEPSIYTDALMSLIKAYVNSNKDIDTNRIYIGGCSNGGYMTMNMLLNADEGYFAAAYPICQAYKDSGITDAQIDKLAQTPIWFTSSADDPTVAPANYTNATYARLIRAGAQNVHYSYFESVMGRDANVKHNGHWSWICTLQDRCVFDQDAQAIFAAADLTAAKALIAAPSAVEVKVENEAVTLWGWIAAQGEMPEPPPAGGQSVPVPDGKFEAEYADLSQVTPSSTPSSGSIIERGNDSSNASVGYLGKAGNKIVWTFQSDAVDNEAELKFCMGSGVFSFVFFGNDDLIVNESIIKITVNGVKVDFEEFLLEGTHTMNFNKWVLCDFGKIELSNGTNIVIMEILGAVAPNLDYLKIVTGANLSWIPADNSNM